MRITNRMLSNNFLRDMGNNMENLQKLQSQLSTGKEIKKPSDDPFKVARAMQLHSDISTNTQYNENIKDASNWLDATDTALDQVTNTLQRVRELMVAAGNAAYGSDEKGAIKDELNQKISEVAQVLNSNFDGKYLFAGSKVTSKPLELNQDANGNQMLVYNVDPANAANELNMLKQKMPVEISKGVSMDYNVTSTDLLNFKAQDGTNIDVSKLLNEITNNLGSANIADQNKITNANLKDITSTIGNLLKVRAEVGAKQNRMESAQSKNEDENLNMTDILSKTEDIDITQKTMEYSTMQTVYMAALQTSAKIIQPSLLDYLR